jgi:arylsulfatase
LFGQRAIRQGHWKIAWISRPNVSGSWELYDLAQDPSEQHDVSAQNQGRFKAMLGLWKDYAHKNKIILHEQLVSPYTSPID